MTTETIYRKVGRRYVPVAEWERLTAHEWPKGHHVTVVQPGSRFTRYSIEPDAAGLIAALDLHREEFIARIRKALEVRSPRTTPLTERQAKAWRKWQDECGMLYAVEVPAAAEAFDALMAALRESIKGTDHPKSRMRAMYSSATAR